MICRVSIFPIFVICGIIAIFSSNSWSASKSSAEIKILLKDEQKELKILKNKIAKQ